MIHESKLFELTQTLKSFSICWYDEKGRRVIINNAQYVTSYHTKKNRQMLRLRLENGEFRECDFMSIVEINGNEIFI